MIGANYANDQSVHPFYETRKRGANQVSTTRVSRWIYYHRAVCVGHEVSAGVCSASRGGALTSPEADTKKPLVLRGVVGGRHSHNSSFQVNCLNFSQYTVECQYCIQCNQLLGDTCHAINEFREDCKRGSTRNW